VVTALRRRIETVSAEAADAAAGHRVLAVEWLDRLFMAGHWVPEMIRLAGVVMSWASKADRRRRSRGPGPWMAILMPCGFTLDQTLQEVVRLHFGAGARRDAPTVYA
jgi:iron complex transport system substrate-binding protein